MHHHACVVRLIREGKREESFRILVLLEKQNTKKKKRQQIFQVLTSICITYTRARYRGDCLAVMA